MLQILIKILYPTLLSPTNYKVVKAIYSQQTRRHRQRCLQRLHDGLELLALLLDRLWTRGVVHKLRQVLEQPRPLRAQQ